MKKNKRISWTPYADSLKETIMVVDTELEAGIEELGLSRLASFRIEEIKRGIYGAFDDLRRMLSEETIE